MPTICNDVGVPEMTEAQKLRSQFAAVSGDKVFPCVGGPLDGQSVDIRGVAFYVRSEQGIPDFYVFQVLWKDSYGTMRPGRPTAGSATSRAQFWRHTGHSLHLDPGEPPVEFSLPLRIWEEMRHADS